MKNPCVYMLASYKGGTLYIGVTSNLARRIDQHESGAVEGFTAKYGVTRLVWFEHYDRMIDAIQREKSLKRYPRQWKVNLIEAGNPEWEQLHPFSGSIVKR